MIKRVLIYSFLIFLFSSCKKENEFDCFKSNGQETSEIRYLDVFTKVEMNDEIEVSITQGAEFKIEVIAGKHIIKNISTKVEERVLKIKNNNKCNFVRGYKKQVKVNIVLPFLYSVLNNGVGHLTIDGNFAQDSIRVRAESSGDIHLSGTYSYIQALSNGNGDMYISGRCAGLDVYMKGTNFLKAEDLFVTDYISILTQSIGDCFINAQNLKKLEYTIYEEGNIYYTGEPLSIIGTLDPDSKGKVIKED